jgi:protein-L-isoaspartate(D-aspartate) O-methyltransferase
LADVARERLARLGYGSAVVVTGDGTVGLAEYAPYDGIVVTACAQFLPDAYVQQLAPNGRIVIPLGEHRLGQTMYRFTRHPSRLQMENLGGFAFVPLIGKYGWHSERGER